LVQRYDLSVVAPFILVKAFTHHAIAVDQHATYRRVRRRQANG
jgi:hypothetical protein